MKKTLSTEFVLNESEKKQVKGGILLTCEEKRHTFLGMTYTSQQWTLKSDGSLFLTVRM